MHVARRRWKLHAYSRARHERRAHVTPRAKLERVRVRCTKRARAREKERDRLCVCACVRARRTFMLGNRASKSKRRRNMMPPLSLSLSLFHSFSKRRLIIVNASRLISTNVNAAPSTLSRQCDRDACPVVSRPWRIALCLSRPRSARVWISVTDGSEDSTTNQKLLDPDDPEFHIGFIVT